MASTMASTSSNMNSIRSLPVSELYVSQIDSSSNSGGYVSCSQLVSTCQERSCDCRSSISLVTNGTTVHLTICVDKRDQCSGSQLVDCSSSSPSSSSGQGPTNNGGSSNAFSELSSASVSDSDSDSATSTTTSSSSGNLAPSSSLSSSSTAQNSAAASASSTVGSIPSASGDLSGTSSASSPVNIPVLVAAIAAALLFFAIMVWFVRGYCIRRHEDNNKHERCELSETEPANPEYVPPVSASPSEVWLDTNIPCSARAYNVLYGLSRRGNNAVEDNVVRRTSQDTAMCRQAQLQRVSLSERYSARDSSAAEQHHYSSASNLATERQSTTLASARAAAYSFDTSADGLSSAGDTASEIAWSSVSGQSQSPDIE